MGTFKKLLSFLVDSAMMYGDEIWRCIRNLETVEQKFSCVHIPVYCMLCQVHGQFAPQSVTIDRDGRGTSVVGSSSEVYAFLVQMHSKMYEERLLKRGVGEAVQFA